MAGEVVWGYGCQVGVYAQHVYTTLPEQKTVLEYLEYQAAPKTNTQQIKDVAGSLLFRGEVVEKPIRVLSGGERARLVLAGLLLQQHNMLVLDEPGNHLDVETVEALAEALIGYSGTVVSSRATTGTSCIAWRRVLSKCGRVALPVTRATSMNMFIVCRTRSTPGCAPHASGPTVSRRRLLRCRGGK